MATITIDLNSENAYHRTLEEVAEQIKNGMTSGQNPVWEIVTDDFEKYFDIYFNKIWDEIQFFNAEVMKEYNISGRSELYTKLRERAAELEKHMEAGYRFVDRDCSSSPTAYLDRYCYTEEEARSIYQDKI